MLDITIRKSLGAFTADFSVSIDRPGVAALFGRSGAGKTTLVNMVAGLLRPDSGRIAVDDRTLFDSDAGIDLPPERRRVGYVFQEGRLFPHLSVRGNLTYGLHRTPPGERRVEFDQVVALLGIGHLLDRRPAKLSGGEKQRVAIGRALLASPRLLLMDEPLAALDAARKEEVMPFIARLTREMRLPILYVSHAMEEILRLADTMILIDRGQAVAAGGVEDILSRLDLRPLTGRYEAGAVIGTTVVEHDEAFGQTVVGFPGGALRVPRLDLPQGARVRVRIHARDVAIAVERPEGVSFQNILPGMVTAVVEDGPTLVDLQIDVGVPLRAQVTRRAAAELRLVPGRPVFALIKTVSIARGDVGEHDGWKANGASAVEEASRRRVGLGLDG